MYLTEKVRQDLFGQGGCHRAQLHGGEGGNVESEGGGDIQILRLEEDKRTF